MNLSVLFFVFFTLQLCVNSYEETENDLVNKSYAKAWDFEFKDPFKIVKKLNISMDDHPHIGSVHERPTHGVDLLPNYFDEKYCTCKGVSEKGRIVNGTPVAEGELAWIAIVFEFKTDNKQDVFACTGSIINPRFVLSTARCVSYVMSVNPNLTFVAAGKNHAPKDLLKSRKNYRIVQKFIIHPMLHQLRTDFGPGQNFLTINDVGLLKVYKPFEFGDVTGIYPACITQEFEWLETPLTWDTRGVVYPPEDDYIVAGYGIQKSWVLDKNEQIPYAPEFSNLTMVRMRKLEPCEELFFCLKSAYGSSCFGDIGAPLHYFTNNKLWVVALNAAQAHHDLEGNKRAYCPANGVERYLNMYNYRDWLDKEAGFYCGY